MSPPVVVRPQRDDPGRRRIPAAEKAAADPLGAAWLHEGALGVDDGGPYLIDGAGNRHGLTVPPYGLLVRLRTWGRAGGEQWQLFVADEHHHRVAELPSLGFERIGLDGFAQAAGLSFVEPAVDILADRRPDWGWPRGTDCLDLDPAHGAGRRTRRLSRRR